MMDKCFGFEPFGLVMAIIESKWNGKLWKPQGIEPERLILVQATLTIAPNR